MQAEVQTRLGRAGALNHCTYSLPSAPGVFTRSLRAGHLGEAATADPYRSTAARPRAPTAMSARPSPLKSKPPATDVPKYCSPGATTEALILCGSRSTRCQGRKGVSFWFNSISRLPFVPTPGSHQPRNWKENVKVLPGRLEGGWGLTGRKDSRGWGRVGSSQETVRGQCSGHREYWAQAVLMWG